MEKQIQELTDKLYKEGVEKGKAQADQIVAEAKQEANDILMKAKQDADALIAAAKKQSEEMKQNTISELKLYAGQTVEAIKSSVTNEITNTVAVKAAKAATDDKAFMQEIILKLVSGWAEKEELVIGVTDAKDLENFFAKKAKDLMDKGLKIEQVNGLKHEFTVAPADGSYKIMIGESEFVELFKEFLRPALVEMLYNK